MRWGSSRGVVGAGVARVAVSVGAWLCAGVAAIGACSPFGESGPSGDDVDATAPADGDAAAAREAAAPSLPEGAGQACAPLRRGDAAALLACEDFEAPPVALPLRFSPEVDEDMTRWVAVVPGRGVGGTRGLRVAFDRASGQKGTAAWGTRGAAPGSARLVLDATVTFDAVPDPSAFAYVLDLEAYNPETLLVGVVVAKGALVAHMAESSVTHGEVELGPVEAGVPIRVGVSFAIQGGKLLARAVRDGVAHDFAPVDLGQREVESTHALVGAFYCTNEPMRFAASFDDVTLREAP